MNGNVNWTYSRNELLRDEGNLNLEQFFGRLFCPGRMGAFVDKTGQTLTIWQVNGVGMVTASLGRSIEGARQPLNHYVDRTGLNVFVGNDWLGSIQYVGDQIVLSGSTTLWPKFVIAMLFPRAGDGWLDGPTFVPRGVE